MSFARFMELALYAPDGGYYRAPTARPGRDGDFITAPELHPIFGATIATAIEKIWDGWTGRRRSSSASTVPAPAPWPSGSSTVSPRRADRRCSTRSSTSPSRSIARRLEHFASRLDGRGPSAIAYRGP